MTVARIGGYAESGCKRGFKIKSVHDEYLLVENCNYYIKLQVSGERAHLHPSIENKYDIISTLRHEDNHLTFDHISVAIDGRPYVKQYHTESKVYLTSTQEFEAGVTGILRHLNVTYWMQATDSDFGKVSDAYIDAFKVELRIYIESLKDLDWHKYKQMQTKFSTWYDL